MDMFNLSSAINSVVISGATIDGEYSTHNNNTIVLLCGDY